MIEGIKKIARKNSKLLYLGSKIYSNIPLSKRLGKEFWYWFNLYQKMESWSKDRIDEYRFDLLRDLLYYIKNNNIYYKKLLSNIVVMTDVTSVRDGNQL